MLAGLWHRCRRWLYPQYYMDDFGCFNFNRDEKADLSPNARHRRLWFMTNLQAWEAMEEDRGRRPDIYGPPRGPYPF